MATWHETSCIRPDVTHVEGNPFCMSCGSVASDKDLECCLSSDTPPIPFLEQWELNLSWPQSVCYDIDCLGGRGDDLSAHVIGAIESGLAREGEAGGLGRSTLLSEEDKMELSGPVEGGASKPLAVAEAAAYSTTLEGADTIRLLRLSSGSGSDPLHGELEVHHLKYFPEYEALSYTWQASNGDGTLSGKLYLGRSWSVFRITSNCEAALRCLRSSASERTIWVDAVCINQTSTSERSNQVQLMPVIYATAKRVIIYLGQEDARNDIMQQRLSNPHNLYLGDSWDDEWAAMDPRLKRPYFFRSWIIQEIAAAKTALVTNGTSWQAWPIYDPGVTSKHRKFLPWINHFASRKYKTPSDLVQLVIDSWSSQARDPRDKVFALLGVISGAMTDGLVADYGLSTSQVYTGFAAYAITRCRALGLLRYASAPRFTQGLPSWVPDWDALSRSWDILRELEDFRSSETIAQILSAHGISSERNMSFQPQWLGDVDFSNEESSLPPASVHRSTGALMLFGFKIDDLSNGYSRIMPKVKAKWDAYPVFVGALVVIGPRSAKETDVVFWLHGLDSPVLLRPQADNVYTLVGTCHVFSQTGLTKFDRKSDRPMITVRSTLLGLSKIPHHVSVDVMRQERASLYLNTRYDGLVDIRGPEEPTADHNEPGVRGERSFDFDWLSKRQDLLSVGCREIDELTEEEIWLVETLGQNIEREWTTQLQVHFPMQQLGPSRRHQDLMLPAVRILKDLKRDIEAQLEAWVKLTQLFREPPRTEPNSPLASQLPGSEKVINETRAARMATSLRAEAKSFHDAAGEEMAGGAISWDGGFLRDGGRWKSLFQRTSATSAALTPGTATETEPTCPTWFALTGAASAWFKLLEKQAIAVAEIYEARAESLQSRHLRYWKIEGWLMAWKCALTEVELTEKCLLSFIEQRAQYDALTRGTWERIVVI